MCGLQQLSLFTENQQMTMIQRALCGALAALSLPAAAQLHHAFIGFNDLPASIHEELNLAGALHGRVIPSINAVSVVAPESVLRAYAADPRVRGVRLQRRLQWHLHASRTQINSVGIEETESHTLADGSSVERGGVDGSGITVAIIDSGIFQPHPDFGLPGASRVIAGANFEGTLVGRETGVLPASVWEQIATASGPLALQDEVGHGTHVAGIVGGDGSAASGLDNQGVARGVNLVALKIASAGNGVVEDIGFEANAVAAIDYMIRNREALGNVRVANNSWGLLANEAQGLLGPTDFDPVKEVTLAAIEAGIVMVFSAGNDGPEPDTVRPIPNGLPEVISVAAACKADNGSCPEGKITGFSSRGDAVDVTAPGDQILATASPSVLAAIGQALEGSYFGDSPQDELQNRAAYIRLSGTSMSAPHVAGVVALMLQANPELTPAQVEQILKDTAVDMVAEDDPELVAGWDAASGFGMVDTRAAVLAASRFGLDTAPSARQFSSVGGGALAWPALLLMLLGFAGRQRGAATMGFTRR